MEMDEAKAPAQFGHMGKIYISVFWCQEGA